MSTRVVTTLTEFLLERIAEDFEPVSPSFLLEMAEAGALTGPNPKDVERMRLECEAKRAIVEEHPPRRARSEECATCVDFHADWDCENKLWPCPTLRVLALPYADHPDFDEAWRP